MDTSATSEDEVDPTLDTTFNTSSTLDTSFTTTTTINSSSLDISQESIVSNGHAAILRYTPEGKATPPSPNRHLGEHLLQDNKGQFRHPSPISLSLRSRCARGLCPEGTGIEFRSRISPSPSRKWKVRSRRRRRSDISRMDDTDLSNTRDLTDISHHHGHNHSSSQHHHSEDQTDFSQVNGSVRTEEQRRLYSDHRKHQKKKSKTHKHHSPHEAKKSHWKHSEDNNEQFDSLLLQTPTRIDSGIRSNVNDSSPSTPIGDQFIAAQHLFSKVNHRERLSSDYFSGSDTPGRLKESTQRLSLRKPFNPYIAYSSDEEFAEWKQQPKTDYTYSETESYRADVTPERQLGSPNMSRRDLHGTSPMHRASQDFSQHDLTTSSSQTVSTRRSTTPTRRSNRMKLRSRVINRNLAMFSDSSDVEEDLVIRSDRSSRSTSKTKNLYSDTDGGGDRSKLVSQTTTTTKLLRYGLDEESDVDDLTESRITHRAVPVVGRAGTSLATSTSTTTTTTTNNSESHNRFSLLQNSAESEQEETTYSRVVTWTRSSFINVQRTVSLLISSSLLYIIEGATALVQRASTNTTTTSGTTKVDASNDQILNPNKKYTVNTGIFSGWQRTVKTKTITTYEWYESHKRRRPLLWCWLPILLLLVLSVIGGQLLLFGQDGYSHYIYHTTYVNSSFRDGSYSSNSTIINLNN